MEIYQKAFDIIEHYFGTEDEDSKLAPAVDEQNQQFQFHAPNADVKDGIPGAGYDF